MKKKLSTELKRNENNHKINFDHGSPIGNAPKIHDVNDDQQSHSFKEEIDQVEEVQLKHNNENIQESETKHDEDDIVTGKGSRTM